MHLLERKRRDAYAALDRRGLAEWARGIKLPSAYSFRGAFDPDLSPWLLRPMEICDDPLIRIAYFISAVRTGKTLVGDLWHSKEIATNSVPAMFNIGNDQDAEEHAKLRFIPLLRSIPTVARKFTENRFDCTNSLIKFIDGSYIIIQGLVNPNNFDSKGICNIVNDEGHKAPPGNLDKARSRTDDFRHKCKILNISQGGTVGDDMDVGYKLGTQEVFGWTCPKCGLDQPYAWRDAEGNYRIKWDTNETTKPEGKWNFDELAKTIRYECANPNCDHAYRDVPSERREMTYKQSHYLPPANPLAPRDTASCHWNQLCVPWIPWREIVIDWIVALQAYELGDTSKLKNFIQRRLAQSWEEMDIRMSSDDDGPPSDYVTGDEWPDEEQRFMAVDVQEKGGRHFIARCRAFASDGRSRGVWAGRLETYAQIHEKAVELGIQGMRVGLDSGHEPSEVQAACAKYGWISLLGSDDINWPQEDKATGQKLYKPVTPPSKVWVGLGTKTQTERRFCYHFRWSKPTFSDILYRRMTGKSLYWGVEGDILTESAYIDPNDSNQKRTTSYWPQLRSYQKVKKRDTAGREISRWAQIGNRHDHYRSCELMLLAMATIGGCVGGESLN